jgi:hypothetical protein
VIGLERGARAARRYAFGLHERPAQSIRPPRYGRFRLTDTKHHPSGRCRLRRAERWHRQRRRSGSDLTRGWPRRHRRIGRGSLASRDRSLGIGRDRTAGPRPRGGLIRAAFCQAGRARIETEDSLRQARDGLIGPGDAFCRPKRRGLWRQACRHPMARSRRVRPIRARWLGQWLARSRCRRRSGRRRRIGPRQPGLGRVRRGVRTRGIAAAAPGRCVVRSHRLCPHLHATIAAITASNSGPDPRPPPRREHAILPVSDRIAARNRAEPTHIKWEYGQR